METLNIGQSESTAKDIAWKIPEHELSPEEQTREWVLKKQDADSNGIEKIFEVFERKKNELEKEGKKPKLFLIKEGTLVEKFNLKDNSSHKEGFLNQDVLAVVDDIKPSRLNLIHSYNLKGENSYSFSFLNKDGEKTKGCFNPDKPIKNFSDKKNREGKPLYVNLNAVRNINDLKELLINGKEPNNLDNHSGIFNRQKKSKSSKNFYQNQISIEEWEKNSKIEEILTTINPEPVKNTKDIMAELVDLEVKKIGNMEVLAVQREWLHQKNVVEISSENLNYARDQIKILIGEGLINIDTDNIDGDKLINQLVCFQSGTEFHNPKTGLAFLHGNILAIPVKTGNFYDQNSRNFIYVGNIDIKDRFRKIKNSNNYGLPNIDKSIRTMTIGFNLHVEDHQAIEVLKADEYYDRSLIRHR